jgi:hypothetical protein
MISDVAHRVKLTPVRVREHDAGLGCDRLHLIGFRLECSCGQRSKIRRNVKTLARWRDQHLRQPQP